MQTEQFPLEEMASQSNVPLKSIRNAIKQGKLKTTRTRQGFMVDPIEFRQWVLTTGRPAADWPLESED